MKNNYYPVLSPYISYSRLNEKVSLLTNLNCFSTKLINKYQASIIQMCNGKNSIDLIKVTLKNINSKIYSEKSIEKFINNMLQKGYLQISPVQLNINISCLKPEISTNNNYFNPSQLHTITISITESCCMKCKHCSQSAPYGKGKEIPSTKIKSLLIDAYKLGARYFGVFGGEPLLHPNIYDIIQYAYRIGYKDVVIFTKGTLIDNDKAKLLKSIGITRIQVSCDSHIPSKYDKIVGHKDTFKKFYQGIFHLLSVGIHIQLKVVLTKQNIDDAIELIDFFTLNGITDIGFEVVVPVGRANFHYIPSSEKIYKLNDTIKDLKQSNIKRYQDITFKYCEYGNVKSCAGGIGSIMVFADGTVSPCDKCYEYRDVINFGNIFNNSLVDIWINGKFGKFRNLSNNLICQQCDKSLTCRGGCPLNSLIMTGKLSDCDITCPKIGGKDHGILFVD